MPHVSLSWLADHVEVPEGTTVEDLAEALTRVGLEEEEILPAAVSGPLVAGKVLSYEVEEHSNGKSVRYVRVDVGEENDAPGTGPEPSDLPSRGIVCGAHNFEVGDTVAVVLPGATLPGPFPISSRKTYGHVSDGMICSERELGLGEDHEGIMVLEEDADLPAPGEALAGYLGLGEEVLEVNVTPDRGYCFAVRGLAREYGHSTGAAFRDPGLADALETELPPSTPGTAETADAFEVVIDEDARVEGRLASDRFVTRIVRGVDPKAKTPKWMRQRLEQAGMRPISLPVDATNYVMLDLGQPLHAYDLRAVAEPFVVRFADEGEPFVTLDGEERVLAGTDLVISDSPDGPGSRIVGLAGVMGGLNSEIEEDTTDVVIEAAHFDPVTVARTSRRYRLSSESSKRFERGVDPNLPPVAAARVAELLVEYGGGVMDPAGFDLDLVEPAAPVRMALTEPKRLTGVDYPPERIVELLEEVGCTVVLDEDAASVLVTPPSWRPDLSAGSAHLVEEIARLDGYDKIPTRLPVGKGSRGLSKRAMARRRTSMTLAQNGLVEVKSYPFVGDAFDRQLIPEGDERRNAAALRNALADDAPYMRTSLLDSLLATAERNASRGLVPVSLFEVGQVTRPDGTVPAEIIGIEHRPSDDEVETLLAGVPAQPWHAAGVVGGRFAPESGEELQTESGKQVDWNWADVIEAVREIAAANGVRLESTRTWLPEGTEVLRGAPLPPRVEDPADTAPFHPGRCATLFVRQGRGLKVLGRAGELHPRVVEGYGLPARSAAFEVDLDVLGDMVSDRFLKAKPVSTYPPVKEDLAVIVPDFVPEADVAMQIRRATGGLLESLTLFDVYRGDQIPDGARSLAYSMVLRAPDRTLKAPEVEKVRKKVIADLEKRLKATVRVG